MPFFCWIRSVRFRLTFWYVLTLAVILAASGAYWYRTLSRNLLNQVDEQLLLVAEDVISFHLIGPNDRSEEDFCRDLEDFSRKHNWSQYIQILNGGGDVACGTSNLQSASLPASAEALRAVRGRRHHFDTVAFLGDSSLRILTYPIEADSRLIGILQIADSLGPLALTLREHQVLMAIFGPMILLFLTISSWVISGRALAPVVQITAAARRIGAESLSQRLPVSPCPDEIADLQLTFNSMLERLEESFNKVRQFTADASHELRTPLAILKGETEVALRWGKDVTELQQTLESNLEEIDRLGRIIDDLLALAKSEAGQIPLTLDDVNLSDLMQGLYLLGKALGEPKSIEFHMQLDIERELHLVGDRLQLHRMLLNLISNAIKYTPEGGRVEVQLAVVAGSAQIRVVDNGIGIGKEHLPHLFDRFYRVDDVRNRDIGGSGLGLSIVQWIAKAHGGTIQVESQLNHGSVFTLTLPLSGPTTKSSSPN
ncbi:MAG: heavy metal sensor histidine kinase [Syntrophaceae bacterium]|nr:heavy metal sensor histidine kinase [Syntrophaceae bacterium]